MTHPPFYIIPQYRVCLLYTSTNDEMQTLNKELTPLLSAHRDDISLNPALFARVKEVYERREQLGLRCV